MVAFRAAASVDSGGGAAASLTLTIPATAQVGDRAFLVATWQQDSSVLTAPTGWESEAAQSPTTFITGRVWRRTLVAGDPGSTVSVSSSLGSSRCALGMIAFADVGDTPQAPTFAGAAADTVTQVIAGITPVSSSLVVAVASVGHGNAGSGATPPVGWTERVDDTTTHASGRRPGTWIATLDTVTDQPVAATSYTTSTASVALTWTFAVPAATAAPVVHDTTGTLALGVAATAPATRTTASTGTATLGLGDTDTATRDTTTVAELAAQLELAGVGVTEATVTAAALLTLASSGASAAQRDTAAGLTLALSTLATYIHEPGTAGDTTGVLGLLLAATTQAVATATVTGVLPLLFDAAATSVRDATTTGATGVALAAHGVTTGTTDAAGTLGLALDTEALTGRDSATTGALGLLLAAQELGIALDVTIIVGPTRVGSPAGLTVVRDRVTVAASRTAPAAGPSRTAPAPGPTRTRDRVAVGATRTSPPAGPSRVNPPAGPSRTDRGA